MAANLVRLKYVRACINELHFGCIAEYFWTFSQKCKGQKAQFDGNVDIMCVIYESTLVFFYKITLHLVCLDIYENRSNALSC